MKYKISPRHIDQNLSQMLYTSSLYVFISLLILKCVFHLGEIEFLPCSPFENIQYIKTGRLKVRGRVVRFRDEELICQTVLEEYLRYLVRIAPALFLTAA